MGKLILISGENNSGKSVFAEELIKGSSGKKYYIATMIPANEENEARIKKHRDRREGMGFTTFEMGYGIKDLVIENDSVVLLEDVSNLLVNHIFVGGGSADDAYDDITEIVSKCRTCVAVTISRFEWAGEDEGTKDYVRQMGLLNERLEELSDVYILMENGGPQVKKGEIPDAV